MTALDYIRQKNIEHKIQGSEIILRDCPYCGDSKHHFYIKADDSGKYYCHKCNARGNIITLQKHFNDFKGQPFNMTTSSIQQAFSDRKTFRKPDEKRYFAAHEQLLVNDDALKYVTEERGISLDTVKRFKLGLEKDADGVNWLTIPHYKNGELVNVHSRSLPPAEKAFKREASCKSILFNSDSIEGSEEIIITEGQIDALTLIDRGIENVVGVTTGAGGINPEWIEQLENVKKIYLAYDSDEKGQKGVREFARRLGYDRCFNIKLPDGQDVNDFFQEQDIFNFQILVNAARQFDVSGIINLEDALEQFKKELNTDETKGIQTGFKCVDKLIKTGLNPGDLAVLSALPKIGKSSFALQIVMNLSLNLIPSLFFCLEMRPKRVTNKIIQCHTCRAEENIRLSEIDETRTAFAGKPLYIGYFYQKPEIQKIIDTIKLAIKRYGLKLVVFDHLHFLCRSVTNQVQEIGLAVQAFKFLAEEMEVPIILIAQPRKIQNDTIMTAMDLKDSSAIYSDCDHLIILHRKRRASNDISENMQTQNQAFDPVTLVRVEASRYNAGGEALLYFHGEYSRFDEMDDYEKFN